MGLSLYARQKVSGHNELPTFSFMLTLHRLLLGHRGLTFPGMKDNFKKARFPPQPLSLFFLRCRNLLRCLIIVIPSRVPEKIKTVDLLTRVSTVSHVSLLYASPEAVHIMLCFQMPHPLFVCVELRHVDGYFLDA